MVLAGARSPTGYFAYPARFSSARPRRHGFDVRRGGRGGCGCAAAGSARGSRRPEAVRQGAGSSRVHGVKVATLRAWRMRRSKIGPPFTRLGKMVLYPMTELENHMRAYLVPRRD